MANIWAIIIVLFSLDCMGQPFTPSELGFGSRPVQSSCFIGTPAITNIYVNPYNQVFVSATNATGTPTVNLYLLRNTTNTSYGTIILGPVTNSSYTFIDSTPLPATTYYYTVESSNSCGESFSSQTNVTTFPAPYALYIPDYSNSFSDYGITPAVQSGPVEQLNDSWTNHFDLIYSNIYSGPPTFNTNGINGHISVDFTTGLTLTTKNGSGYALSNAMMFMMVFSVTGTINPGGATPMPIFDDSSLIAAGYSDISNNLDWGMVSGTSHIQGGSITNGSYMFTGFFNGTNSYIDVDGSQVASGSLDEHAVESLLLTSDDLNSTIHLSYLAVYTNMPPTYVHYYENMLMYYYSVP